MQRNRDSNSSRRRRALCARVNTIVQDFCRQRERDLYREKKEGKIRQVFPRPLIDDLWFRNYVLIIGIVFATRVNILSLLSLTFARFRSVGLGPSENRRIVCWLFVSTYVYRRLECVTLVEAFFTRFSCFKLHHLTLLNVLTYNLCLNMLNDVTSNGKKRIIKTSVKCFIFVLYFYSVKVIFKFVT